MPIIYRPDPIADFINQSLTNQAVKNQIEHERELAERKKQQRLTGIGIGAGLGAIGGLALGGASLAAGGTIPGTALPALATATIPTSALVPGLTGLSLGADIGGRFADEDYAGAITGLAQGGLAAVDYKENERLYGYQPSREGRASLAALAEKAGTTIDALKQGPGTIAQKLAAVQG